MNRFPSPFTLLILIIFAPTMILANINNKSSQGLLILETQKLIRADIEKILAGFDPKAKAYVKIEVETVEYNLEGTSFVYETNKISEASGLPTIKKIDVKILSTKEILTDYYQKLIKNLGQDYNAELSINYVQIPTPEIKTQSFFDHLSPAHILMLGLSSLFFILLIIGIFGRTKSMGNIEDVLKTHLSALAQKSTETPVAQRSATHSKAESPAVNPVVSNDNHKQSMDELNTEGVVSLLSDCYWCENDQYAAYFWNHLGINTKMEAMESWPFLKDYANYISQKEPQPGNYHLDPYYLLPLNLQNYDNHDLQKLIEKENALFHHISKMRKESLHLSIKQKITLLNQEKKPLSLKIEDKKLKADRTLKSFTSLVVSNVDDEIELMTIEDPDLEIVLNVKSLIWAMRIEQERFKEILAKYTAQELAEAWIGPDEVLARMESLLPQKKASLLKSYMVKVQPSRQSETFLHLHNDICIKYLHKTTGDINSESSETNNAA